MCVLATHAVATIGFNQSVLEITEGDSNATEVCVQASGVMERGVTVYLQIDNLNSDGMVATQTL